VSFCAHERAYFSEKDLEVALLDESLHRFIRGWGIPDPESRRIYLGSHRKSALELELGFCSHAHGTKGRERPSLISLASSEGPEMAKTKLGQGDKIFRGKWSVKGKGPRWASVAHACNPSY
jgi:hypothetical protein